ncbi:thiamine pyrophosphate-binding protein [Terrarubrum flagellatum]|uniref:thiamine pyrophosphate-binding protein n=1 Tax=Terrirubrum flagellatum TaxID=2895980 RepID=UPI003144EC1D
MEKITAGEAIVKVLEAEGVTKVFGIPGGHILNVYDAVLKSPTMEHILARHEQCAASMASGYAQLTGEPGICTVTAGPGATNLVSGIAEAFVGSLPVIIIAARAGTNIAYKGAAQDVDTTRLFEAITKWSVRVHRADSIVTIMRQAFTVARSGKPGPVFVDIPRDYLPELVEFGDYLPVGRPAAPRGNPKAIAAAADALVAAKNPLIVAGGGAVASGAVGALRRFAERLAIPVITSLAGRGIISDDHPLSVGGLGAHRNPLSKRLLAEADCVLGLGTRFEEMETNWRAGFLPDPKATYIQVDTDGSEIGRSVPTKIGIIGDVREVLEELDAHVKTSRHTVADFTSHPRVKEFATEIAKIERDADELAVSMTRPIHPLAVIRGAREVFPKESTVSIDVGVLAQQIGGAFPFFKVYEPRSLVVCSSFYGMGFASAGLPVAKVVYPKRPALGFVGDGSFQMVMAVLPTAVEHRLPVTWIILNDQSLGSIRDIQERAFGNRIFATDFSFQPDFAKLAEACGCYGETIKSVADVKPALERALTANEEGTPAVLDFLVARERLPQTLEFFPFYSMFPKPGEAGPSR